MLLNAADFLQYLGWVMNTIDLLWSFKLTMKNGWVPLQKPDMLSQILDHDYGLHNNKNMVLIKLKYLAVCTIKKLVFEEEECSILSYTKSIQPENTSP